MSRQRSNSNSNSDTLFYNYGLILKALKRPNEALERFNQALSINATVAETWNNRGTVLNDLARYDEAIVDFDRAIGLQPGYLDAFCNRGKALTELKRYDEALASFDKALAVKSDLENAWLGRGLVLGKLKRYGKSLVAYDRALALKPDHAEAWLGCGNILYELHRYDEALAHYDRVLALKPDLAGAWYARGNAFYELKRHDEALAAYNKATAINSGLVDAWLGCGNALSELKRYDEALMAYGKTLMLKPGFAEAWLGQGNVFSELRSYDKAFVNYDEALAIQPNLAGAWLGRSNVLYHLKRYDEALAACDRALSLEPDLPEAWLNRGNIFNDLKHHEKAADAYSEVLRIDRQHPFTKGLLLHQKMLSCDWKELGVLIHEIDDDVTAGRLSAEPFAWMGASNSPKSLQLCSEIYSRNRFPDNGPVAVTAPFGNHDKIRIGYSSGEFHEQATSRLIVGLLECHDHEHFEIYGIDNGWDDRSELRRRIDASVHTMIDISRLSDPSAAAAIREHEIDILVNLNGYFGKARTGIFAGRAAAIQVNYLGFPGTLGASYMDYIVADQIVIPENHKKFYSEKIAYLPNCYQANDNKRKIGAKNFSRREYGLPESGFVFCCFNNNYKILPDVFACWMRILKAVNGSVLWIIEDNKIAAENLKREAAAAGVRRRSYCVF